jgi:hypothetical protein
MPSRTFYQGEHDELQPLCVSPVVVDALQRLSVGNDDSAGDGKAVKSGEGAKSSEDTHKSHHEEDEGGEDEDGEDEDGEDEGGEDTAVARATKEAEVQNDYEDSLMVKELAEEQYIVVGEEKELVRATWETILAYAADQEGESAAGRGPKRATDIEDRYRRYSQWCAARGHTGVELVLAISMWQSTAGNANGMGGQHDESSGKSESTKNGRGGAPQLPPCTPFPSPLQQLDSVWLEGGPAAPPEAFASQAVVALEPNIVPYHCEAPIEHWVLWYHPDVTDPSTDLDPQQCAAHVRQFLSLHDDELVVFQNLPMFRSVPQVAHAHVFIRPLREGSRVALQQLRLHRRLRSPWVEAERIGGRGAEVGF